MLGRVFGVGLLTLLLLANGVSFAQSTDKDADDSTKWVGSDTVTVVKKKHSAKKATIMSVCLPGLGQIYNRQYWKVPIIAAGAIILVTQIVSNNFDLKQANRDLNIRVANNVDSAAIKKAKANPSLYDAYDPLNPANYVGSGNRTYTLQQLQLTRDGYRRERDFYVIISALVYALNIVDAAVFAHLREFEVSDNLSMKIDPVINFANKGQPYAGFSCRLYLTK
jgi:hypothetical protein